jgi:hypothetical protein
MVLSSPIWLTADQFLVKAPAMEAAIGLSRWRVFPKGLEEPPSLWLGLDRTLGNVRVDLDATIVEDATDRLRESICRRCGAARAPKNRTGYAPQ